VTASRESRDWPGRCERSRSGPADGARAGGWRLSESTKDPKPTPDFSPLAGRYARSRPSYPDELFEHLARLSGRHDLAWDAATGNGQAALGLAAHFRRVIATDISGEQIRHAVPHPRIEYKVAPSEDSGLEDGSVDVVTVAAAAHWFDLAAFGRELRRVVRPGGLLAVWTYHIGIMQPPFDRLFEGFYRDVVAPYFGEGARLVDARYRTLDLPGEPLQAPELHVSATWNLAQLVDFIHSWSGTQKYKEERGIDPVSLVAAELEALWGRPDRARTLQWPLFVRVTRL